MPDRLNDSPDDRMSDRLDQRLAALADDVRRVSRPAEVERIRARGQRRQDRLVLSAVAGAVVLVLAVPIWLAGTSPDGPLIAGSSQPARLTTIPAALRMPHEAEAGWTRNDDSRIASALNPCGGADVTLVGRTDAATMTGRGSPPDEEHSPTQYREHLFIYESDNAAETVIQELSGAMTRCGWAGGPLPSSGYGDETLIGAYPPSASAGPFPLTSPELNAIVTRRGNALIILYAEAGGMRWTAMDTDSVLFLASQLCEVMGLCEARHCFYPQPSPSDMVWVTCPQEPYPAGTPDQPQVSPDSVSPYPQPTPSLQQTPDPWNSPTNPGLSG